MCINLTPFVNIYKYEYTVNGLLQIVHTICLLKAIDLVGDGNMNIYLLIKSNSLIDIDILMYKGHARLIS